jgi:phosphoenolpyruvate-protein kinase (PTS system EI component)
MTDINVVKQIQDLRRDLNMEVNLFHEQIELPLNEALIEDKQISEKKQISINSGQLSRGIALSKWFRKITSQFESIDPFYK